MKVLHVMASGAAGGGASHLLTLLPALERHDCQIEVIVGDDGPLAAQLKASGISAHSWPLMGSRVDVFTGRELVRFATARDMAMHIHGSRAASLVALALRTFSSQARPQRIYHAHGLATALTVGRGPSFWLRRAAEQFACWQAAGVISCSSRDAQRLALWSGLPASQMATVGNVAVTPSPSAELRRSYDHLPPWGKSACRTRLGLPLKAPLVVTLSRLVPQKDIVTLLSAVSQLEGVHLAVAGDGPERPKMLEHELARSGRLHWLGTLPSASELLHAADVVGLTSRWEGEPVLLLEAMAHGLPWVATTTEGSCQLAISGSGLLASVGEPAQVASCLQAVLTRPAWAKALSTAGRDYMSTRSAADQARQVRALYERWFARRRS